MNLVKLTNQLIFYYTDLLLCLFFILIINKSTCIYTTGAYSGHNSTTSACGKYLCNFMNAVYFSDNFPKS